MLAQDSSCPPTQYSSGTKKPELIRHSTHFHPCIWGDLFYTYTCDNMKLESYNEQVEELKEEARSMLRSSANKPLEMLNLIDTLQRLGLAYHFEIEIDKMVERMFDSHIGYFNDMDDLHVVALYFRLLRQHGYNIPCDVFNKFRDEHGKFRNGLTRDTRGMLSLYEAAHLGIRGQEILDEALSFTTAHIKSVATNSSSPLVEQVIHALEQSLHRGMTKLEARHYISFYEKDPSRNEVLLKLAKLDFNRLKSLHLEELGEISRWWKDLDFASKIPYARNRVVECYFCIMGVYPEPQYSFGRTILTKVTAMTSILDDTYDAYGTFEELQLFTDAIERWEVDETDKLPEYMKVIYLALLDIYNEIEEEIRNEGRSYCVSYAKEEMKVLIRTYFIEAKWFSEGHIPTFKEYLENALVSCGYAMILLTSFVGMGEIATKEVFDWVSKTPKIVRSACLIGRLMDDIVSNEFEQERGHVSSAIECYMNENGVSREEAITEIRKLINNTWKDINEQCLRPTAAAMPLLMRAVNLARVFDVAYKREDGYTNAHVLKAHIVPVLIDPIPI